MTTRENIGRIFRLLAPYKSKQIQTLVSMIAAVVLSLLLPLILRYLIDDVIGKKKPQLLLPLVGFTLAVFVANSFFNFFTSYLFNLMGQGIVRDIRRALFAHMMRLPFGFFSGQGTGRIMARVLNDVATIGAVVSTIVLDILIQSATLVAIFVIMLLLDWRLAVVASVAIPLYIVVIRFFNSRLRKTSYITMVKHAEVSASLQESLSGVKEIRSFNRERSEVGRFTRRLTDFLVARVWLGVLSNAAIQIGFIVSSLSTLLIIWYGGASVLNGTLTMGTLIAFWAYLGQLYGPINKLMSVNVQLQDAAAAFTRIDEIFSAKPTVLEREGARSLEGAKGQVEFADVSFSYGSGSPVLSHLTFSISPGERVAIVGRSGCGKTTIAGLLERFYDPEAGAVRLDGIDLRDLKLAELRRAVALVSQDTFLFNASIKDNIEFGGEGASEEEIAQAAQVAGVTDFASSLPEGLASQVGERGVCLSGGERQRIAIARAILRNPAVLVLDEATSQIDSRSERQLRATLERVMQGRTSIMIAHRLSTVSGAQRILVLDRGAIAEEGTHQALLERRGIYYSLYEEQARLQETAG